MWKLSNTYKRHRILTHFENQSSYAVTETIILTIVIILVTNFFLDLSLNPDPTQRLSIWSLIIGGAFGLFPLWAVNQTAVQRFLAAKSDKEAKL